MADDGWIIAGNEAGKGGSHSLWPMSKQGDSRAKQGEVNADLHQSASRTPSICQGAAFIAYEAVHIL